MSKKCGWRQDYWRLLSDKYENRIHFIKEFNDANIHTHNRRNIQMRCMVNAIFYDRLLSDLHKELKIQNKMFAQYVYSRSVLFTLFAYFFYFFAYSVLFFSLSKHWRTSQKQLQQFHKMFAFTFRWNSTLLLT